jgi:hypothetical protein
MFLILQLPFCVRLDWPHALTVAKTFTVGVVYNPYMNEVNIDIYFIFLILFRGRIHGLIFDVLTDQ